MFFTANGEVRLGAHGEVLPVHCSDAPRREADERTNEDENDSGVPNGELTRVAEGRIHEPLDPRIQGTETSRRHWRRDELQQGCTQNVLIANVHVSFKLRGSDVRILQVPAERAEGNPQEREVEEEASERLTLLHVVRFVL